jgi:hypothetical protein
MSPSRRHDEPLLKCPDSKRIRATAARTRVRGLRDDLSRSQAARRDAHHPRSPKSYCILYRPQSNAEVSFVAAAPNFPIAQALRVEPACQP